MGGAAVAAVRQRISWPRQAGRLPVGVAVHAVCRGGACVDPTVGRWTRRGCCGGVAVAVDRLIGGAACCRDGMGVADAGSIVTVLTAGTTMHRRGRYRRWCRARGLDWVLWRVRVAAMIVRRAIWLLRRVDGGGARLRARGGVAEPAAVAIAACVLMAYVADVRTMQGRAVRVRTSTAARGLGRINSGAGYVCFAFVGEAFACERFIGGEQIFAGVVNSAPKRYRLAGYCTCQRD